MNRKELQGTIKLFFRDNVYFLSCFALFLLVAAILLLVNEKGDAIFFFSDNRTVFGNYFFRYVTRVGEEYGYYAAILVLLFYRFRYAVLTPLVGITVFIASFVSKAIFLHDRPSLYFRKLNLLETIQVVDGVELHGGTTSFPSGHTMSGFALCSFLAFCLSRKLVPEVFFFVLALLVGISRIYLVQHFLQDVYLGAIIGVVIGAIWYFVQIRITDDPKSWWNKSVLTLRKEKGIPEEVA